MEIPGDKLIGMYRTMLLIRRFEETAAELYSHGRIWGGLHLCLGQEATATGACAALRLEDMISSTHRGHGHCIAKGGDVRLMMAELFGRATGYCKGKGGSMHIADLDLGILGANGIVGAGLPIAVGAALGAQYRGLDSVSLAFFSDGATNTGAFHEALSLAAVLKVPAVFMCENNGWAVSTPTRYGVPVESIATRAAAYGIPAVTVDGNDVVAVYGAVRAAVARARGGEGPSLVEGVTYRWSGHYHGDPQLYRSKEEVQEWRDERDPIALHRCYLLQRGLLTEAQAREIEEEVEAQVAEAVRFAEESPVPTLDSLHTDIYAPVEGTA